MNLKGTTEFIFIGKGRDSFVETYAYELTDATADKAATAGSLYMCLELSNNQAEAEAIGEAVFNALRKSFYANQESEVYERFEEALKAANHIISSYKSDAPSRFIGKMHGAVSAVVGDSLFISTCGQAEVYLIRKKFVSVVSEGLVEDANHDGFSNIANGQLEKGDCVLLSSARLLRYATKTELGKLFAVGSFNEMGHALSDLQGVLSTEIIGRMAVLGLYISTFAQPVTDDRDDYSDDENGDEDLFDAPHSNAGIRHKVGAVLGGLSNVFASVGKHINVDSVKKSTQSLRDLLGRLGIFDKTRSKVANALKHMPEITDKISGKASKLQARFGPDASRFGSDLGSTPEQSSFGKFTDAVFNKIRGRREISKDHLVISAVIVIILLFGGIFWLRSHSGQAQQINEQQARLNHVRDLIGEASTVGQYDKDKASEIMKSAEEEALSVLNSRFLRADALKVLEEIQSYRDALDDVKRVKTPTVLADLTTKRPNASALGVMGLKDQAFAFEYNALYEMVLDKLQDPITISDVESVILGAAYPEGDSLLFLTRSGKMLEFKDGRFGEVTTKDGLWKKGMDMETYNDRLYVLDPDRNQIWRYQRRREGFDIGEAYNQDADLKNAVALAIDSSIYVMNKDGTISQMYQGKRQEFPLRRSPLNAVEAATKIFTAPDMNFIYILEPGKNRVIVYRKDIKNGGAQYQTQYVFEGTGALRDMYVYDNRLYVNDDKKVYFVNLAGL